VLKKIYNKTALEELGDVSPQFCKSKGVPFIKILNLLEISLYLEKI